MTMAVALLLVAGCAQEDTEEEKAILQVCRNFLLSCYDEGSMPAQYYSKKDQNEMIKAIVKASSDVMKERGTPLNKKAQQSLHQAIVKRWETESKNPNSSINMSSKLKSQQMLKDVANSKKISEEELIKRLKTTTAREINLKIDKSGKTAHINNLYFCKEDGVWKINIFRDKTMRDKLYNSVKTDLKKQFQK
ncbi:MAG: hypothetical protein ACI38Q_05440 [Candidatus Bruticola sp.]